MGLPDIEWIRPDSPRERARLDAWRLGVGDELFHGPSQSARRPVAEEVAVVVWNTHVGAADVAAFVSDLERGLLTGGAPVEHYLLLLQEVHRGGSSVPQRLGTARAAARIHGTPPSGLRADLCLLARERGLHLLYVPSMRNGREPVTESPEDRGNAILSTLPLSRPRAFELPFERQRRVAIGARVAIPSRSGVTEELDVVNLHLDPRSEALRAHRSFGAGRERQVAWLLDVLGGNGDGDGHGPVVLGGDFNTWAPGRAEAALTRMRSRFTQAELAGTGRLRLDHIFFDVPREWRARFSLHPSAYGSDHRPIIGGLGIA